jgi:hypothetical protein
MMSVGTGVFSAIVLILFCIQNLRLEGYMAHTIKHKVPTAVKAWLKKEVAAQRKLHKKIMKEINVDLASKRAQWYEAFFDRIKSPTRGFNVHFTERRQITDEEIPSKPRRKDRVVW